jgi:hypothetical protein
MSLGTSKKGDPTNLLDDATGTIFVMTSPVTTPKDNFVVDPNACTNCVFESPLVLEAKFVLAAIDPVYPLSPATYPSPGLIQTFKIVKISAKPALTYLSSITTFDMLAAFQSNFDAYSLDSSYDSLKLKTLYDASVVRLTYKSCTAVPVQAIANYDYCAKTFNIIETNTAIANCSTSGCSMYSGY